MKILKKLIFVVIIVLILENCNVIFGYDDKSKIIEVSYISQEGYPTGCESASTVMALNHMGYNIDIPNFIDKYLPTSSLIEKDGELFGNSPNEYFIGNPRSKNGLGCYAPVIYNAVSKVTSDVKNLTGTSLKNLCKDYIDNNIPVIVWATLDMQPSQVGKTWKLINNDNQSFTWISKEHCLLLVGYDNKNYYFNDPYNNNGLVSYKKNLVERRFKELGCQSVVITG